MPLPNFLIIGAQKAGTTWLAQRLSQHPDIFMAGKEIHFFDKDYNFAKGVSWYETHFADVTNEQSIGEKTPDYLWANGQGAEGHIADVHKNIHSLLPDSRLIIILRNPVERAISAVNHIIRSGRIAPTSDFEALLFGDKQQEIAGHGVLEYGFYYEQICAFKTLYPPEQLLVLIFERDIVKHPQSALKQVCEFLNVDTDFEFYDLNKKENFHTNSQVALYLSFYLPFMKSLIRKIDRRLPLPAAKSKPSAATYERLYQLYEAENRKLFDMLGYEINEWNQR